MSTGKDVRWRQRFENFEKAYRLLAQYVDQPIFSELERAGIIQLFEISFELSWKLLKDYLEAQGISVKSPREAIKQAYQMELIGNGHIWMDALEDRNRTVHTYDEQLAEKMVQDIVHTYFPELKVIYDVLKKEL